jgi:hypothetical protein
MDLIKNTSPDCAQIAHACRLYETGGEIPEFIIAFKKELTQEGIFLAYHAAKVSFDMNVRTRK